MVVMSEPPPNVAVIGDFSESEGGPSYEGTRNTAHDRYSSLQVENPSLRYSQGDRSVQASIEPLNEKLEQEE